MKTVLDLTAAAAVASLRQMVMLFGVFFACGLLLYILSKFTRNIFHNAGHPNLDIYVTGWIGTPVHELGHVLFCILFRHTITDMKLFPHSRGDGSLGYVTHKYNRWNIYQQTGNLFIGAGPVILGTLTIAVLAQYLLPNGHAVAAIFSDRSLHAVSAANIAGTYPLIASFSITLFHAVFAAANIPSIGFWVFMYIAVCIASHMGLSPSDMKGMGGGIAVIVLSLFVANIAAVLLHADLTGFIMIANEYTTRVLGVFILAMLISAVNFTVTYLVLGIVHYRKNGSWVSFI